MSVHALTQDNGTYLLDNQWEDIFGINTTDNAVCKQFCQWCKWSTFDLNQTARWTIDFVVCVSTRLDHYQDPQADYQYQ